jgi:uncharacterized protein
MAENSQAIPPNIFNDLYGPESFLAFFPMFLLGLYVGKRRILHEPERHLVLIRSIAGWGFCLGLTAMVIERLLDQYSGYRVFGDRLIDPGLQFLGDATFAFGATALALGYAALVVLLARHDRWRALVAPLAAVGRMALSVYLLQTLMFSTLFYGYGFGQAGRMGPAAVLGCAVVFFAVQVVLANWWLRYFRFGPAEWLWRSLTYRRWQPMRLEG